MEESQGTEGKGAFEFAATPGQWLDDIEKETPEGLRWLARRVSLDFPMGIESQGGVGEESPISARLIWRGSLEAVEAFFGEAGWRSGTQEIGESRVLEERRARQIGAKLGAAVGERHWLEHSGGDPEAFDWEFFGRLLGDSFAKMSPEMAREAWKAAMDQLSQVLGADPAPGEARMAFGALESGLCAAIGAQSLVEAACAGALGDAARTTGRSAIAEASGESGLWREAALRLSPEGFAATLLRDALWASDWDPEAEEVGFAAGLLPTALRSGLVSGEELEFLREAALSGLGRSSGDLSRTGRKFGFERRDVAAASRCPALRSVFESMALEELPEAQSSKASRGI